MFLFMTSRTKLSTSFVATSSSLRWDVCDMAAELQNLFFLVLFAAEFFYLFYSASDVFSRCDCTVLVYAGVLENGNSCTINQAYLYPHKLACLQRENIHPIMNCLPSRLTFENMAKEPFIAGVMFCQCSFDINIRHNFLSPNSRKWCLGFIYPVFLNYTPLFELKKYFLMNTKFLGYSNWNMFQFTTMAKCLEKCLRCWGYHQQIP